MQLYTVVSSHEGMHLFLFLQCVCVRVRSQNCACVNKCTDGIRVDGAGKAAVGEAATLCLSFFLTGGAKEV